MKTATAVMLLLCPALSAMAQNEKQGILNETVVLPVVINGKTCGTVTVREGTKVVVVKEEPNYLTVKYGASTARIPANKASIQEQAPPANPSPDHPPQSEQGHAGAADDEHTQNKASDNNVQAGMSPKSAGPETAAPSSGDFSITIADENVQVRRLGTGKTGIIFFNNSGPMDKDIEANIHEYNNILEGKASFFLWSYPKKHPFTKIAESVVAYYNRQTTQRVVFEGIADDVISQVAKKTGIDTFIIVGNSLGAGIVLWDYDKLVKNRALFFLLISPTEVFMPEVKSLPGLERTVLYAAKESDVFVIDEAIYKWIARHRDPKIKPPRDAEGHFIVGDSISHKALNGMLLEMLARVEND